MYVWFNMVLIPGLIVRQGGNFFEYLKDKSTQSPKNFLNTFYLERQNRDGSISNSSTYFMIVVL